MKKMNLVSGPLALAGAGIGLGVVGQAFNSQGLMQGGQVATNFVPVAVNVSAGGYLINQLRSLRPNAKVKK